MKLTQVNTQLLSGSGANLSHFAEYSLELAVGTENTSRGTVTPNQESDYVTPVSGQPMRVTVSSNWERRKNGLVRILIRTTVAQAREPVEGAAACCCSSKDTGDDLYDVHTVITVPAAIAERIRRRLLVKAPEPLVVATSVHAALIGGTYNNDGLNSDSFAYEPVASAIDIIMGVLLDEPAEVGIKANLQMATTDESPE